MRPPQRFEETNLFWYALAIAEHVEQFEPSSYKETLASKHKVKWIEAMDDEMDSLLRNNTWQLVDKPEGRKSLGRKWLYKLKEISPGNEKVNYKARLVAKGYAQFEEVDFNEIYSPVVKHCSIRLLLTLVAQFDLELEQLDVKTTFLNGDLEETIYMDQPKGYITSENKDKVFLFEKISMWTQTKP